MYLDNIHTIIKRNKNPQSWLDPDPAKSAQSGRSGSTTLLPSHCRSFYLPLKLVALRRCHSLSAFSPVSSGSPAMYMELCTVRYSLFPSFLIDLGQYLINLQGKTLSRGVYSGLKATFLPLIPGATSYSPRPPPPPPPPSSLQSQDFILHKHFHSFIFFSFSLFFTFFLLLIFPPPQIASTDIILYLFRDGNPALKPILVISKFLFGYTDVEQRYFGK